MLGLGDDANDARLTGLLNFMDTGAGHARIRIYGTSRPGTAGGSAGGTHLVEIALDDPCGSVVDHELVLVATVDAFITSTGVAAWARIVNGNGDFALDCDVTTSGGGGEITLNTLNLYAGGLVRLVSAVLS